MPARGSGRSVKWEDVIEWPSAEGKKNQRVEYRYYSDQWTSRSLQRINDHMKKCRSLPLSLYSRYRRDETSPPPKKAKKQAKLDTEFITMGLEEQAYLDRLLAEAIYSSGIPFAFVRRSYRCSRS